MGEWKEYAFSEVLVDGSISYGIVQPGRHTEIDSVPIIRVNNIKNGNIRTNDVLKVQSSIEGKYKRTRLSGGELLITIVGSVGECAIVPPGLAGWNVARAVSVARINEKFDKRFIKYSLKTPDIQFQMYGNTNDTVQPTLNLSSLKVIKFLLPPLSEQRAISGVLSSLDEKIDLLHRQNQTLEALAETLFRQWFIEESEEDWDDGCLGDVADNIKNSIKPNEISPETKYIGLEHIDRKNIALSQCGLSADVTSNKYAFVEDDILFGKLRPYFHKVCFTPHSGVCSTDILVIRPKDPQYFCFCLFAFFQSDVIEYANLGSGGTRMPRTNWATLKEYPIKVPCKATMKNFNNQIMPSIEKIKANLKQIHTLEKLRDTLLPKLMSGEVRVS